MRKALIFFTLLFCFASQVHLRKHSYSSQYTGDQFDLKNDETYGSSRTNNNPKPFLTGNEYIFDYNSQIATGLVPSDTSDEPGIPQQKAVTRMQAQVKIQFQSDLEATLQLQNIKIGELNDVFAEPERVKPMAMFEPKVIPAKKKEFLQLPCNFVYADGVIQRIRYQQRDEDWSKNIKRAVLNMIQVNLKMNNAQGLRLPEEMNNSQMNRIDENMYGFVGKSKAFMIPETTLEGECMVLYTVGGTESKRQRTEGEFNVTKSIDFKNCRKISDVAYGFQVDQTQSSCAQFQMPYYQQQLKQKDGQSEERRQPSPFEQCDAKEVKENKLSRSTVIRLVLKAFKNQPEAYGIKRAEITSQYVLKSLKAEVGQFGSAMHAVAAAEMDLQQVRQIDQSAWSERSLQGYGQDEKLLFSNQWIINEKRFHMYGDDEFNSHTSPFKDTKGKVALVEQSLRQLAQTTANPNIGIEIDTPIQLQELVDTIRKLSMDELKIVDRSASSRHIGGSSGNGQAVEQLYIDALAIAGTRNTIALLAEKIMEEKVPLEKAIQAVMALSNLPAPSDSQVELIQKLCQSGISEKSAQLKQTCWLTFGAIVNELCQHKTQRVAQMTIFGQQSGFNEEEICSESNKMRYLQAMVGLFKSAKSTYEKVVAVKSLGNAGIDTSVVELEKIIKDKEEETIVRTSAVDSLRRMRVQIPRRIQNILAPIFMNNREEPELRMVSLAILMRTVPGPQLIDQIAMTLTKERSNDVLSFAYYYMKAVSMSRNPLLQKLATNLQNALKLINVDEKTLRMSGLLHIPMYSDDEQEGIFLNMAAAFVGRQTLPVHLSTRWSSFLNDEFRIDDLSLSFSQQNAESTIQKLLQRASQYVFKQGSQSSRSTRAQRIAVQGQETPHDIYSMLGIKSRHSFMFKKNQAGTGRRNEEPSFASINFRVLDVDQFILPITANEGPTFLRALMAGQISSFISELGKGMNGRHIRNVMANSRREKRASIPSSVGMLLNVKQSFPLVTLVDMRTSASVETPSLSSPLGVKAQIEGQVAMNVAHIQKIEVWMCETFVTGVKSIRSLEINLPLNVELKSNMVHGLQAKIKMPTSKNIQLVGIHTIPMTFTTDYDQQTFVPKEEMYKTIHNPQVEQYQREIYSTIGRSAGIPLVVKGHYYRPSKPTNYKQLIQMLMAAENQIHMVFEPNQQTPREVIFRVQASQFEKMAQPKKPRFDEFYGGPHKFESYSWEDAQDFEELGSHRERSQRLLNYVDNNYQSEPMYKHGVKLSVQTVGGQKEAKALMEVLFSADSKFKIQMLDVSMERTPIDESGMWTMKANVQLLQPESVSSVQQLKQLMSSEANKNLVVWASADWGKSDDRQHINLRLRGEQAMKPQWRQIEHIESQVNKYFKRRTSFLNKYDVIADYKVQPFFRNFVSRIYEALKARNFWNTQTELTTGQIHQGQGVIRTTFIIDPITQEHANVTVKTPWEQIRIQAMQLPMRFRPWSLVRSSEKSTHSALQMINRFTTSRRAECSIDGFDVSTFDEVSYKAPLSKCYSVLAKDCSGSDRESKFTVLMKAIAESNPSSLKKIKVVTPTLSMECEPKTSRHSTEQVWSSLYISCKANGQPIDDKFEYMDDTTLEYNNPQKSDVTIHVEDVSVRFNGQKAWVKISNKYKWGQCGLCGHYDNRPEDEWRMGNNELTDDLEKFHRSYLLEQNEECNPSERDSFYSANKQLFRSHKFGQTRKGFRDSSSSTSSEESDDLSKRLYNTRNEWEDQSYDGDDKWFGYGRSRYSFHQKPHLSGGNKGAFSRFDEFNFRMADKRRIQEKPVPYTMVMEKGSTKVCFSVEPVNQCPAGTYASTTTRSDDERRAKKVSMKFACLPRYEDHTHRLMRQARAGIILDEMRQRQQSFTETIYEPTKCVRYSRN